MSYLLDTDVVADWLNNRPGTVSMLAAPQPADLAISLITYGEIYNGIYHGRDPHSTEQAYLCFLRGVTVLPLTAPS
jgi:predicted nucleic acid-binding protein